jgi:hypothetical protein
MNIFNISYSVFFCFFSGLAFCHPSPEAEPEIRNNHYSYPAASDASEDASTAEDNVGPVPRFDGGMRRNMTAIRGRDIELTCKVYDLGNKTVSTEQMSRFNFCLWIEKDENTTQGARPCTRLVFFIRFLYRITVTAQTLLLHIILLESPWTALYFCLILVSRRHPKRPKETPDSAKQPLKSRFA